MEMKTYTEQIAEMARGIKKMMSKRLEADEKFTADDAEMLYLNCLMLDCITATAEKLEDMDTKLDMINMKVNR